MINIVALVFFTIFVLVSLVELVLAFHEMEKWRKIVKPFSLVGLVVLLSIILRINQKAGKVAH